MTTGAPGPGPGPAPARPRLIAYRGAPHAAPEHTLAALETALAQGADGLAVDVRLTADDQLVVIRSARLDRTTDGHGPVRERTLRELKRLDAGRWFGRAFRGQRLQALGEVLERFRERALVLVVLPEGSDFQPGIEDRLVDLLQTCQATGRTLVASPDHHALRRCRRLDPELPLVALVGARLQDPGRVAPAGAVDGLGLPDALTTAADLRACRAAGLAGYVWDVSDPGRARQLAGWGAAGLVTDRPDLLRAALEGG